MNTDGAPATLMRPIGHGLTGTTVLLPISRHLLAAGAFEDGGGVHTVERNFVATINALVMAHADRYVFAPDCRFLFSQGFGKPLLRGGDLPSLVQARTTKGKKKSQRRAH